MGPAVAVARALGIDVVAPRATSSGQGRSAFAVTDEGIQVVVKWSRDPGWGGWIPMAALLAAALRVRGYPLARTIAHGPAGAHGYGWVLERLPGDPCADGLDVRMLEQVMEAVALQADADDIPDGIDLHWSWVAAAVHDDEAGWWRAARALGPEVADLCNRLDAWVRAVPRAEQRNDFVHLDLNFSNILAIEGALTGIVDLDHMGLGDRSVDLVQLLFEYEWMRYRGDVVPSGAVERLHAAVLSISGEPGWREAVAYNGIASLGWSSPEGLRVPLDQAIAGVRALIAMS